MQDDPIFMFFYVGGAILLIWWLVKVLGPTHHLENHWRWRMTMLVALGISLLSIYYVLTTWASFDVVDAPFYIFGYLSLGVIWITGSAKFLGVFADIRFQQDVRERNNLAAAIAIGGLLVGSAIAYAGGNIGDGPGFYVVIFSALLSSFTVYGVAWVLAICSEGEERISIDHDIGAAIRLAAVAVGIGIISGRAAAGNWVSIEATVRDFAHVAWPVLPLTLVAIINEKTSPPNYSGVSSLRSVVFGIFFIGISVAYVMGLGRW